MHSFLPFGAIQFTFKRMSAGICEGPQNVTGLKVVSVFGIAHALKASIANNFKSWTNGLKKRILNVLLVTPLRSDLEST